MLQGFLLWITNNYIELTGTIFGLLYILFSIKQNIWCWFFGLISSAIYIYVFFISKLYADTGLQIYYVAVSIYGWHHWMFGRRSEKQDNLKISKLNNNSTVAIIVAIFMLFAVISIILIHYTDSDIPYWDAFTTAASFVATWMLARKILEHWIIWIIVDSISVALYIYKELYSTVILYGVYTFLAVLGYIAWKKDVEINPGK